MNETTISSDMQNYLNEAARIGRSAQLAFREVRKCSAAIRNKILLNLADKLRDSNLLQNIITENQKDLTAARENGLTPAMIDRLELNPKRINGMIQALEEIVAFPDPVGEILGGGRIVGGIEMIKKRVPLGVVFCIFESRPNVTVDIGALSLKSGNVAILRGGREALHTNRALHQLFQSALTAEGLPAEALILVTEPERDFMTALLQQDDTIDLVVPRGGEGLIRYASQNSRIPLVKHDKGVCNLYIDQKAELSKALAIAANAKLQRPSVCNAIENLLIHKEFAEAKKLLTGLSEAGARLRGCSESVKISPEVEPISGEEEYDTEYLDERLSVKIVGNLDEALDFIHRFGSGHSEGIVSNDHSAIDRFVDAVDSAALFINCSTRFHDGGQMGMGAEVGISTGRLHVRGPMGLRDLTTTTYILKGEGQIRE